jgi:hypothetical protein
VLRLHALHSLFHSFENFGVHRRGKQCSSFMLPPFSPRQWRLAANSFAQTRHCLEQRATGN